MIKNILLLLMVFTGSWISIVSAVESPDRHALVIGNSDYAVSPLKNTVNDALLIKKTLEEQEFKVTYLINLEYKEMIAAIKSFESGLSSRTVALFYYAGHALQFEDKNYLIPITSNELTESELEFESVDLKRITDSLKRSRSKVKIVILDACRNNPFSGITRSQGQRGLGAASADAEGMIISYATAPGQVALDGTGGKNSPFSRSLAKNISIPGLSIEQVFKRTRADVISTTNRTQIPWENSSLTGDFYFSKSESNQNSHIENVQLEEPIDFVEEGVTDTLSLSDPLSKSSGFNLTEKPKTGPRMLKLALGEFTMGGQRYNEGPKYQVTFDKPLLISQKEISISDYNHYLLNIKNEPFVSDQPEKAISGISWEEANNYCLCVEV